MSYKYDLIIRQWILDGTIDYNIYRIDSKIESMMKSNVPISSGVDRHFQGGYITPKN